MALGADIIRLGKFGPSARPEMLAGQELLYSSTANKPFVVEDGKAVPLDVAAVVALWQAGLLEISAAGREQLAAALDRSSSPPTAAALSFEDGFLPLPPDFVPSEDIADLMLLQTASTLSRGDLSLAESSPGTPWSNHVRGLARLATGQPDVAAPLLLAAYEADPLDIKALDYYLVATGRSAGIVKARLPLVMDTALSGATPASDAIAEVLERDISGYPEVSSRWQLLNLAVTAGAILVSLADVFLLLLRG